MRNVRTLKKVLKIFSKKIYEITKIVPFILSPEPNFFNNSAITGMDTEKKLNS